MNAPFHPVQTAADVLVILEQANLPATKKRDMISGVRRICAMAGCSPESLPLEVPVLRARLSSIRPAAHGISKKTFFNLRSLFATTLAWAGVVETLHRGTAKKSLAWAPVVTSIAQNKALSKGLATFMNWCATNGIKPTDVDDETLQRFGVWLENRTLHARPRNLMWQIPQFWSVARRDAPGWPQQELTRISFRPPSPNLRWDDLPSGLRAETEAYLDMRANPDLFDTNPNVPARPLAESTVRQQKEHIRMATSVLVRQGVPLDSLCSLADLVRVDCFKTVLRHYHNKAGGNPSSHAILIAKTLIDVARYHVRVSGADLAELKRLASKLPSIPFDLSEKNKALLRDLESEQVRARLLYMPDELMRRVKAGLTAGALRHATAQVAVAVEILLSAPLRPQNLISLNWNRHFREPEGPKGKLVLYIPKDDTKTRRRDLVFEIPPELAENIRFYRREILPRLGADSNGDLFVVPGGRRKSQKTLSQQIAETIAEVVGILMSPHQFRHAAATLLSRSAP